MGLSKAKPGGLETLLFFMRRHASESWHPAFWPTKRDPRFRWGDAEVQTVAVASNHSAVPPSSLQ